MIKIKDVDYHRNGVTGTGFHVVSFSWSRKNFLATVFPERSVVAVINSLAIDDYYRGDDFENVLRLAVLDFERKRAAFPLEDEEVRDLTYGVHEHIPYEGESKCVVCGWPSYHGDLPRRPPAGASEK